MCIETQWTTAVKRTSTTRSRSKVKRHKDGVTTTSTELIFRRITRSPVNLMHVSCLLTFVIFLTSFHTAPFRHHTRGIHRGVFWTVIMDASVILMLLSERSATATDALTKKSSPCRGGEPRSPWLPSSQTTGKCVDY